MTIGEARRLGARDGIADVETVFAEQGLDAVAAMLRPGYHGWTALIAAAHAAAGLPDAMAEHYYAAYAVVARAHARYLVTSFAFTDEQLNALKDRATADQDWALCVLCFHALVGEGRLDSNDYSVLSPAEASRVHGLSPQQAREECERVIRAAQRGVE